MRLLGTTLPTVSTTCGGASRAGGGGPPPSGSSSGTTDGAGKPAALSSAALKDESAIATLTRRASRGRALRPRSHSAARAGLARRSSSAGVMLWYSRPRRSAGTSAARSAAALQIE